MIDRAFSTIGLWLVVGLVIWVGGRFGLAEKAAFGILCILVVMAQYEFYKLVRNIPGTRQSSYSGIIAGFALLCTLYFNENNNELTIYSLKLVTSIFGVYLIFLLSRSQSPPVLLQKLPTFFGFLYLPVMLAPLVAIVRLENPLGLYYVLWVVIATKFTDVGGLIIGVPFGKHKIAPQISPAKSWEGVLGGIIVSALVSAAFAWFCNHTLGLDFMVPYKAALLALPLAALSVPSDLIESVFKRQAGAKDSGHTIPGIGGALDLIDSLVLTAPVALILLSYFLSWAKVAG